MTQRRLNATAASLLGFLHRGPMSGWDLAATADEVIGGFWSLTRSQVYRELAWMAEAGLVEAGDRGSRERQPYTLTATGRAAFAEWADQDPGPETIRFPLLLKLSFGRQVPAGRLAAFVASHRRLHAERLAGYQQLQSTDTDTDIDTNTEDGSDADVDPYRAATLAFGIGYEHAVLAWFDTLPPEITSPAERDQGTP